MIEIEHIGTAAFVVAPRVDGSFVYRSSNAAVERLSGLARAALVGHTPAEVFGPEVGAVVAATYRACVERGESVEVERLMDVPRGTIMTRTLLTPIFDRRGRVRSVFGVVLDTTEKHRLREDLRRSQVRLSIAVESLGAAHWFYDKAKRQFEFSPAFARISGIAKASTIGIDAWLGHVHPDDREDTCFIDILAERIEQGTAEFRVVSDAGEERWLRCRRGAVAEDGVLTGVAGIVVDVTQEKRREAALSLQATSDPLTGLDNRRAFDEALPQARAQAQRMGSPLSLLMVDIDHFKAYNDHYGHVAGDAVLRRVAQRLADCVKAAGGLAARFGGEEFAAILPGRSAEEAAGVAADMLARLAAMNEPHAGSPLGRISVSIGVAAEAGARPGSDLVALADIALYRVKREGRNGVRVFTPAGRTAGPSSSAAA